MSSIAGTVESEGLCPMWRQPPVLTSQQATASEEARLDDVWNDGQAHWLSFASSAQLITVNHTSHNIQLDRPDVVLDKIHELLQ